MIIPLNRDGFVALLIMIPVCFAIDVVCRALGIL